MGRESGEKLDKEVKKLSQEDEMVYLYTKLSREELEKNTLIEEAKELGFEQGKEQGAYDKQKKMVIKLLNKQMSIEEISEITELAIEEIEKIKSEL